MKQVLCPVVALVFAALSVYAGGVATSNVTRLPSSSPQATDRVDITTLDGKLHKNCSIIATEPDGITIMYSNDAGVGTRKIAFADLSDELRKMYGHNAAAEQEYASQREKRARVQSAEQERAAVRRKEFEYVVASFRETKEEADAEKQKYDRAASNRKASQDERIAALMDSLGPLAESSELQKRIDLMATIMKNWDDSGTLYGLERKVVLDNVRNGTPFIGMPKDLLLVTLGSPITVNIQEGEGYRREQLVYREKYRKPRYYYIEGGVLTTMQE